jgi:membrane protease YdiL (CAAX protease family)
MIPENTSTPEKQGYPQYSLLRVFGLSVIPGILVALVFAVLTPVVSSFDYPPILAFLLAVLLIGLPFELGTMLYLGKKENNRYSLQGIVLYRESIPAWQYLVIIPIAFVVTFAALSLLLPVESSFAGRLFAFLPDWVFMDDAGQYASYNQTSLMVIFILAVFVRGIAIPIVEELYFRGFLLPRISRFKVWAPVIGGLFFAVYHIWQPMAFLTVFVTGIILGAIVQWKRNVYLSIALHMLANTISAVMALMLVLGGS